MTRRKRLRRVAILCCHCLRNLAFYMAGWRRGAPVFKDQFWVNVNGNFLDICVLEWCKLFGDLRGKHYWQKVISDPTAFYSGLLRQLGMAEAEFDAFANEMRTYRDKFVAHLDSEEIMHIPNNLILAQKSVSYLYDYLRANEDEADFFVDAPKKASTFYDHHLRDGKSAYNKLTRNIANDLRRIGKSADAPLPTS